MINVERVTTDALSTGEALRDFARTIRPADLATAVEICPNIVDLNDAVFSEGLGDLYDLLQKPEDVHMALLRAHSSRVSITRDRTRIANRLRSMLASFVLVRDTVETDAWRATAVARSSDIPLPEARSTRNAVLHLRAGAETIITQGAEKLQGLLEAVRTSYMSLGSRERNDLGVNALERHVYEILMMFHNLLTRTQSYTERVVTRVSIQDVDIDLPGALPSMQVAAGRLHELIDQKSSEARQGTLWRGT